MKLGLKFFAILMVCVLFVAVMYGIHDLIAERQQLAERVNVSSCYISQIERGLVKNAVSLPVLISIAEALHIDMAALFQFQDLPIQK